MSEMISSPARPFYQSVSLQFLKPVPLVEYEKFARFHFTNGGKAIEDGVVSAIYNRFDGTTWYIQKMLNQLYAMTPVGATVTAADTEEAERQIIMQSAEAYKDMLVQLTSKQRDLAIAISKEGKATQITSASFVKRHKLTSASSVQKAVAALVAKQLVTQYQGTYELYDKFMAYWLRKE